MELLVNIIQTSTLIIIGYFIWLLKSKVEELRAIEERLRIERKKIYEDLLEPFAITLAGTQSGKEQEYSAKAIQKIQSPEYRMAMWNFNFIASDDAILAFNSLMQSFYQQSKGVKQKPRDVLNLLGGFLLELRKSLGNKKTKLGAPDMLKGMLSDIDEVLKS